MREALDPRTTFEVALVRLTHPDVDDSPATVLERLERLERRVQELAAGGAAPAPAPAPAVPAAVPVPAAVAVPAVSTVRPGAGAAGGTPALGAYLQRPGAPAATTAVPSPPAGESGGSSGAADPSAAAAGSAAEVPSLTPDSVVEPPAVQATPPAEAPAGPSAAPEAPPSQAGASHGASQAGASQAGAVEGSRVVPATSAGQPSRDDLVTAWADHVLPKLRPRARAVYAGGRFVAVEEGDAVFALPNAAHVEHADPLIKEVAAALSSHFSAAIGLRLITETDLDSPYADPTDASSPEAQAEAPRAPVKVEAPAARRAAREAAAKAATAPAGAAATTTPPEAPETEDEDFDDLEPGSAAGPHDSRTWAENRLLEEFPGAEEVT